MAGRLSFTEAHEIFQNILGHPSVFDFWTLGWGAPGGRETTPKAKCGGAPPAFWDSRTSGPGGPGIPESRESLVNQTVLHSNPDDKNAQARSFPQRAKARRVFRAQPNRTLAFHSIELIFLPRCRKKTSKSIGLGPGPPKSFSRSPPGLRFGSAAPTSPLFRATIPAEEFALVHVVVGMPAPVPAVFLCDTVGNQSLN